MLAKVLKFFAILQLRKLLFYDFILVAFADERRTAEILRLGSPRTNIAYATVSELVGA